MKLILYILVLGIFSSILKAQDLIVTKNGDSLNCRIIKTNNDYFYLTIKRDNEIRNTEVSKTDVVYSEYGFFEQPEVPGEVNSTSTDFQHFRFSFFGGYSYLFSKYSALSSDFDDYMKELKSGYHFGADFTVFFSETLGAGLKYYLFRTANSIDNVFVKYNNASTRHGTVSNNIATSYFGPSFTIRLLNGNKTGALMLSFSLGYVEHKDKFVLIDHHTLNGSTMAVVYDLGYELKISKNVFIGIQASLLEGLLSSYKLSDGGRGKTIKMESEQYLNLTRLDISAGIRILL
jgi:hypothetical protein